MSLKKTFQPFISNHTETSENHYDEQLKSRYYKTTSKKALEIIRDMLLEIKGCEITSFSEERGEIGITFKKGLKVFGVISIISVRPFETAVDLSLTTETGFLPMDFGNSRKMILAIYEQVDKTLPYIGSGLNPR